MYKLLVQQDIPLENGLERSVQHPDPRVITTIGALAGYITIASLYPFDRVPPELVTYAILLATVIQPIGLGATGELINRSGFFDYTDKCIDHILEKLMNFYSRIQKKVNP